MNTTLGYRAVTDFRAMFPVNNLTACGLGYCGGHVCKAKQYTRRRLVPADNILYVRVVPV